VIIGFWLTLFRFDCCHKFIGKLSKIIRTLFMTLFWHS